VRCSAGADRLKCDSEQHRFRRTLSKSRHSCTTGNPHVTRASRKRPQRHSSTRAPCATIRESMMAMQVLTVRGIEALNPRTKRYEVFDALTPSLAIRVTPSGHKSWTLYYRHHGRQRRLTLDR